MTSSGVIDFRLRRAEQQIAELEKIVETIQDYRVSQKTAARILGVKFTEIGNKRRSPQYDGTFTAAGSVRLGRFLRVWIKEVNRG